MPLIKRAVQPTELSRAHVAQGVRNELECVTNNTLSNVIRQLSSLSKHAEDMFAELFVEANTVFNRANNLHERVSKLNVKVTQLDSTQDVVSLQDINMRKPFKSSVTREQQIISKRSRPRAIEETYLDCDAPPALSKLNPYREDGKDSIKFYTDPTYFFELWCQQMQKNTDMDRKRRGKRHRGGPRREANNIRVAVNRKQENQMRSMGAEFYEGKKNVIHTAHIDGTKLNYQRPDKLPVMLKSGDYVQPNSMYNSHHQQNDPQRHSAQQQQVPSSGGYGNGPVNHMSEDNYSVMSQSPRHSQYPQHESPLSTPSRASSRTSSVQSPARPMSRPPPPPQDANRGNLPTPPPPPPPPPAPQGTTNDVQYHHPASPPQVNSLPDAIQMTSGSPARSIESSHGGGAYSRGSTPNSSLSDPLPPPPPSPPASVGTPVSATSIPPPPPPPPPPPGMIDPPPPPPPPPMSNGPMPDSGGGGDDGRNNLLDAIRQGTTLKSTAEVRAPSPEPPDARSDLLRAIQTGIQLRKIDRQEKHQQQRRNTAGHLDVQAIMEAAFEMRRQAMERDSSSEGESDGEDGGWSDSDE